MSHVQIQMKIKAKTMHVTGLQQMLQDESIPNQIRSDFWETFQYETKMHEQLKQRTARFDDYFAIYLPSKHSLAPSQGVVFIAGQMI